MRADPCDVALVASACRFPDAASPAELLRNSLEGRQSFRAIPPTRLQLRDYRAEIIGEADSITPIAAALLTDWQFDMARFRISRSTYHSVDLTHWLALETAADAIAGIGGAERLDRDRTAVIVANTLTGEFSRTAQLRLRWPWLDRALHDALQAAAVPDAAAAETRRAFRARIDATFRAPDEETLAGGLANTIAGRIANHFDLHGGAWSVDAACASSLVAVAEAASLITAGRADAVIVVAVDLSLDPFELVGFSRNHALAPNRMRVFDARAEGFWPGEGAGAVILMADASARAAGHSAFHIAGWGVATDGRGGLTRPEVSGQARALERAYIRTGVDRADIGFVEAHGTGTAIGDPTEVRALAGFIGDRPVPLPIASIKGNIGHTKAAAGLAGLIRTAEAMREGVIPVHSSCDRPHSVFAETGDRIRVATIAEAWPAGRRIAGVSSFGFGGVNAHIVLKAPGTSRTRPAPATAPVRDAELFLFAGAPDQVAARIEALAGRAATLSFAELSDAAAHAATSLTPGPCRLAFVASAPDELVERLVQARAALNGLASPAIRFGMIQRPPRIGFAFPGQAAPVRLRSGAWGRRFPGHGFSIDANADPQRTDTAQTAIVTGSLAGLALLDRLGINAHAAIGHSLGDLTALAWSGAIPRDTLPALAAARGRAMAAQPAGAMLRLACDPAAATTLLVGLPFSIACFNGPAETVIAGPVDALPMVERAAAGAGIETLRLRVPHAFHTPAMAGAEPGFAAALAQVAITPAERRVASSVTGAWLTPDDAIPALLLQQLVAPVRFLDAARAIAAEVDAIVEVGPGTGLSRLLSGMVPHSASLDVGAETTTALLDTLSMLFALGADIDPGPLFEGSSVRPLVFAPPILLSNPCGRHTAGEQPIEPVAPPAPAPAEALLAHQGDSLSLLIAMTAELTGLPIAALSPDDGFLDDLHLNSLAVNRLLSRYGSALGKRPPGLQTDFANASLRDVAAGFDEAETFGADGASDIAAGVAPWVRRFIIFDTPLPDRPVRQILWHDDVAAAPEVEAGLIVTLPAGWNATVDAPALVDCCRTAAGRFAHLAIRHAGAPLSGFARSIAAERLFESVRLIDGSPDADIFARDVIGFEELRWRDGGWTTPRLGLAAPADPPASTPTGTVLVTGGARGIAAECAILLGERYRLPLILAGRSQPDHPEIRATLDRLAAAGVPARYVRADVADAAALATGVHAAAEKLGPVTHLVHAAGLNEPVPFTKLETAQLRATLAAKVEGLTAAIDACGDTLVRVIAFGSIIGRLGLAGEAHYALANAEQSRLLEDIAAARPGLSALSIEWSIWSGAGMGERIGTIERLRADGVEAIPLDAALAEFEQLALGSSEGAVVVTSRYGEIDSLSGSRPMRFLDRTKIHVAGVELVCETHLGPGRDRYLDDHRIDGRAVMPGVLTLEAMAQIADALQPDSAICVRDIAFSSAIDCEGGSVTSRIGALRDHHGIRVELRTAQDGYRTPVASARFVASGAPPPPAAPPAPTPIDAVALYGPLFFQGLRFERIAGIGAVSSRSVTARFGGTAREDWFSSFEPQTLVFGDPGLRDAALHALQCCVPHRQLVPLSVRRLDRFPGGVPTHLVATERWSNGDDYAFDIQLQDGRNNIVERWDEAVFHAIGELDIGRVLAAAPELARAYLERRARTETGDDSLALALVDDPEIERAVRRARAAKVLGFDPAPGRRSDGRPIVSFPGRSLSFAHSDGFTLAVSSAMNVGCDVERIDAFASDDLAHDWTAEETLRKLGSRAALWRDGKGLFSGAARERIATLGSVPTRDGLVAVAVGVGPSA